MNSKTWSLRTFKNSNNQIFNIIDKWKNRDDEYAVGMYGI